MNGGENIAANEATARIKRKIASRMNIKHTDLLIYPHE